MYYSVITINYNNCNGLRHTIESVVNQTFRNFEYIVVDGGSTDGSVEVIKEYETNINYWISEHDGGIYNAMNKGIAQAHGEYCIFMNSGDLFYYDAVLFSVANDLKEDINSDDKDFENLNLYDEIYIDQALELSDMIFDNNLDKIYFLKQYFKSFDINNKKDEYPEAKVFTKKKSK